MTFATDVYSQRTFDFIARLQELTDYEDICRAICVELEHYGMTRVTCMSIPGPAEPLAQGLLLNTRPQDYTEHYERMNYVNRDPVVTELRTNLSPLSWSDVRQRRSLSKAERAIIDEGREFDARNGLIVPIVTLSGQVDIFSPCGREPDLSARARTALEIIGIYSHQALARALVRKRQQTPLRKPLTPREREVLQWVAAGKTDDEIGEILSISGTTVTTHVEKAKEKLDARSRTYAVVQAIRAGEIAL